MSKRLLQILSAVLAAVPVVTGILGMFGISDPLYAFAGLPHSAVLDSNLRFFAGVWCGLGIALYGLIPTIEKQTVLFRALWGMIFLGGIGRLISILALGLPPIAFLAFAALEIIGAPLFILWQGRLAK